MGLYRKQKPTESDAEYELYREARRLEHNAKNKTYYAANRESLNTKHNAYYTTNQESVKAQQKANNLKRKYWLTIEEYNDLIENGCNLCGTSENLCVDHCHTTGKVRGCLCIRCNVVLGQYENYILPNIDKFTQYLGGTL